jgi:hypothetical protein
MVLLALWFALRQYVPKLARHRFEAAGAAGLTIVMIPLLGTPWLVDLFPVNQIGVAPFLALMTLPVALIAATGAEEWLRLNPDQTHATIRRFVISCAVLAAFFIILLVAQILSGVPEQNLNIVLQVVLAALFGIATLAILAVTIVRTSIPFMGYGLTVLTLIGTLAAMYPAAPLSKSALSFPNTSFVNDLKETGVRVSGSSTLENWPLEANLVSQVYTPSGIQLSRYAAFRKRIGEDPMLVRRTGSTSLLLTREDIQGAFAEVRPLLRIKRVFSSGAVLFDDLEARPRAWFTYEGRPVHHFDAAQLSANLPPLMEGVTLPEMKPPATPARISLNMPATGEEVTLQVETRQAGVLVLADSWYPGWHATVDGQETPVFPVDGLFRGVQVPEGNHDVQFIYTSGSFRIGLLLSAFSIAVMLLGTPFLLWRRLQRRSAG